MRLSLRNFICRISLNFCTHLILRQGRYADSSFWVKIDHWALWKYVVRKIFIFFGKAQKLDVFLLSWTSTLNYRSIRSKVYNKKLFYNTTAFLLELQKRMSLFPRKVTAALKIFGNMWKIDAKNKLHKHKLHKHVTYAKNKLHKSWIKVFFFSANSSPLIFHSEF